MPTTLQQQFRNVERQMRGFVTDGDVSQEVADRILEDLRRKAKDLRADKR